MRILLDSHVLVWQGVCPERLSEAARGLLEDDANVRLVSVATLWEIAIKVALGKLALQQESIDELIDV